MDQKLRKRSRERYLRGVLLVASVIAVLGTVAVIEAAVRLSDPELMIRRRGLHRYHSKLGWETRANVHAEVEGAEVSLDRHGFRTSGEVLETAGERPRLLILGDSVSFGLGVSDKETFAAQLSRGESPYRVTNLSVSGYGPDQSLLRYEMKGRDMGASFVIFGLCLANDVADVASAHHLYDERVPKPRFVLDEGRLLLHDEHVRGRRLRALLDRSFLLASFVPAEEGRKQERDEVSRRHAALRANSADSEDTLVAIIDRLRQQAVSQGASFLLVAFPDIRAVERSSNRWPRLRKRLEAGVRVLDLTPVLARNREMFARNTIDQIGHLSVRGHEVAAKRIRERLLTAR